MMLRALLGTEIALKPVDLEIPRQLMLDPLSAFIFVLLFSLMNGAVLGFIHRALTPDVQPSAADWRIGTLIVAGGAALFVGQAATHNDFLLPLANGYWLFGLALYWRAVRRFFGLVDSSWIYLPVIAGTAGNAFFVFVVPSVANSVAVASVCWIILILGSATTLIRNRNRHRSTSATVLCGIFIALAMLMLLRGLYFVSVGEVVVSIAQPINLVNAFTPLLIAVLPVIGTTVFVLLCFERIRAQLQRVATTDALTGLPNRLTIGERAVALFAQAPTLRLGFSIAVIDIDHFKQVNDRYGHHAGDLVLRAVAQTLATHCRGVNVVGRQGGEEFVALFNGATAEQAMVAAERLRAEVEAARHSVEGAAIQVTISVGVASFSAADREFAEVLRRADRALYTAKADGRNCVQFEGIATKPNTQSEPTAYL